MAAPAGKQPKVMVVEGAEGGMVSACDHQQRHISELPCLAGIHEQQRAISGSHKSESSPWPPVWV